MTTPAKATFPEGSLHHTPIRALGLRIEGTQLAPIVAQFERELAAAGLSRVKPAFYLTTEWGVPMDTVAIGIPFYLADPELTKLHAERVGYVEGTQPNEILRYLRHEMGHVVNYAYRFYDREDWVKLFGSITQPYLEEYRPEPFSDRFVVHLPGWYAQKHPDEDWAETFAVWMTPGSTWKTDYADRPVIVEKLRYCERTIAEIRERDPLVTSRELDEDVGEIPLSVEQYYAQYVGDDGMLPRGLDGALRTIFEDEGVPDQQSSTAPRLPAALLLQQLERDLMANVYRWTGHFPERTQALVRHLTSRAEALKQVYPQDCAESTAVAVTALVTALALNHVHHGSYHGEKPPGEKPHVQSALPPNVTSV